jgi:hypothetical protein
MGFLDIFRGKPKQCTSCGRPSDGLHGVFSGQRRGAETDRLCTECLLSRLDPEIARRNILFIEPLTTDSYCYFPFGEVENRGLTEVRVRLALASLPCKCASCASAARHIWMPLSDLDNDSMNAQPNSEYYPIPSEPAHWRQSLQLCNGHMIGKLKAFVGEKGWSFLTFRFPSSSGDGYYS